jgi:hypothetical protein
MVFVPRSRRETSARDAREFVREQTGAAVQKHKWQLVWLVALIYGGSSSLTI